MRTIRIRFDCARPKTLIILAVSAAIIISALFVFSKPTNKTKNVVPPRARKAVTKVFKEKFQTTVESPSEEEEETRNKNLDFDYDAEHNIESREGSTVRISPDGKYISFLAAYNDVENLWVQSFTDFLAGKDTARALTTEGIYDYRWTYIEGLLVYLMNESDDPNYILYSVDIRREKSRPKKLTGGDGQAKIFALSHALPDWIIIGWNKQNLDFFDMYRINLANGEKKIILENDAFDKFYFDNELRCKFAVKNSEIGGEDYYFHVYDNKTKDLYWNLYRKTYDTQFVGFDRSGLWVHTIENTDQYSRLVLFFFPNYENNEILLESKDGRLIFVWLHPVTFSPILASNEENQYTVIDQQFARDVEYLMQLETYGSPRIGGDLNEGVSTLDMKYWLVNWVSGTEPEKVYLYDRSKREAILAFVESEETEQTTTTTKAPR